MGTEGVRLETLHWDAHGAAVCDLYRDVFSEAPYEGVNRAGLEEALRRQADRLGFDGRVAFDERGVLLGFAYGWALQPGQREHRRLQAQLGLELSLFWLADCFELADLGVRREFRRRGVGSLLHDALLSAQPCRTALVSTNPLAAPAQRFYLARGWRTLLEPSFYSEGTPAQRILGLELTPPGGLPARETPGGVARSASLQAGTEP